MIFIAMVCGRDSALGVFRKNLKVASSQEKMTGLQQDSSHQLMIKEKCPVF